MIMRLPVGLLLVAGTAPCALSQGTDLGGGIVTRKDVEYLADLTLDVRDIDQEFASTGGTNAAMQIYTNGKNSDAQGASARFSLAQLSTRLANHGLDDAVPSYLYHLYGMADRSNDIGKLSEHLSYADNFARTSIMGGRRTTSEAINVLNMWMYATHLLFDGAQKCLKKAEADNPDIIDFGDGGFDEFIAIWIGSGQVPGSSDGYSLYSLAEQGDDLFSVGDSTFDPEDNLDEDYIESLVNKRIKLLYQEGASLTSVPEVCTSSTPESPKRLWTIVNRIVSQMYIPLFQLLINAILEKDSEAVQVYAMALIPQAAQCRPSTFKLLRDQLLGGNPSFDRTELVLSDLQELYSCFGLTCDDIGLIRNAPADVALPECVAAENDAPMAEYQPSSDVLPIARIDHDILQLRILTSLGSFFNARLLYTYGRNSPLQYFEDDGPFGFYSIRDFALSANRKNADPFYNMFVAYHNDPNYANTIISETLTGIGKWGQKSVEQRSAVITETSAFMVLYMHLLGQMYGALNHCKGNAEEGGEYDLTHPWDEVAALLIGSLEGTSEGGSSDVQDGQLIWGLSTRRAFQFQTLNGQGYSKANSQLEDLLFAGRGELDALDCDALSETVERVRQLTLAPILQSVLRYGIQNEQHGADSTSEDLALGETYALSVIPIIRSLDPASAVQAGSPMTRDGAQTLANAVGTAAVSEGLRCSFLGSTPAADPCALHSSASGLRPLLFSCVGAVISLMF
eukprot:CAMPEP_0117080174 /NCGR_PEP_ID=MMETSP0472-20121206/56576_1 /TAXON_ID=693140 ORGANISM="Tiarina fusus, Strain LIS" /NCGR_SAMPLE_ID=MMETSP0472 /ASSEMBLY_ACC=CAM_ASM_000603 /LENGTH=738 /DNA_ID=CAMNT_0004807723 /DNA_START=68 /DNA_END=2281 /DNA_ORIENTATION=-